MSRPDGRKRDELRPVQITPGYVDYPEGSVLIQMGKTRVLCNATLENEVPRWMKIQNVPGGWVTAEYAMLPRATQQRTNREGAVPNSRSQEIRRLIGRSLRSAFDLELLGPRTITIDCDVLQADGGTRTAAITGGYIAAALALRPLVQTKSVRPAVFKSPLAAISVGMVGGAHLLDLCYAEDSQAEVDANLVMNDKGEFIEIQATAEGRPFARPDLDELLRLGEQGIRQLLQIQQAILQR